MGNVLFQRLRDPQKLSEMVSQQIGQAILDGRIRVQERLPTEGEFAESFGVSRTAVREAMQNLKAQGLVRSVAGSGSYVEPYRLSQVGEAIGRFGKLNPEKETFLNLLDLRLIIEAETADRCAEKRAAAVIERLEALITAMKMSEGDLEAFARADMEFHLSIADSSGNPLFRTILEPLKSIGVDYGLRTYDSVVALERTHQEHEAVYKKIEAGDGPGARRKMRAHITSSREHYLSLRRRGLESLDEE